MFKSFVNAKTALAAAAVPVSAMLMAAPAFASSVPDVPGVAITTEMLSPILDGVTANIGVIMPVAVGIFAIILGVTLIPRIFKLFKS